MQFDLGPQQPVGVTRPIDRAKKRKVSACRWAFPLCPDGGRKDSKVTRVVEMEWASRVAVGKTTARSLDRRIGRPSTSSKHPRGDHPSRTGSCVPGWSWTNTLNRARMVTCLMTCQARRPLRWAPRHVQAEALSAPFAAPRRLTRVSGPQLIHSNRPKTARECAGSAVNPLEPSQDGSRA